MLTLLTPRLRLKAALWLAVLYAFCVLAPHAALALGGAQAHCLMELGPAHGHQSATHAHADGTSHAHAKHAGHRHHDTGKYDEQGRHTGTPADCCGLFCLSAMAEDAPATLVLHNARIALIEDAPQSLTGRAPGRINRPPIV